MLVVDLHEGGRPHPSGILDFGDLCSGDPAYDLAAAWLVLPADAQDLFFTRRSGRQDVRLVM